MIQPDVLLGKPRRGSSGDKAPVDGSRIGAQLGCPDAVDIDIHCRIVDRLSQLDIPQLGYLPELFDHLRGIDLIVLLVLADHFHLYRRRRTLTKDLIRELDGLE